MIVALVVRVKRQACPGPARVTGQVRLDKVVCGGDKRAGRLTHVRGVHDLVSSWEQAVVCKQLKHLCPSGGAHLRINALAKAVHDPLGEVGQLGQLVPHLGSRSARLAEQNKGGIKQG